MVSSERPSKRETGSQSGKFHRHEATKSVATHHNLPQALSWQEQVKEQAVEMKNGGYGC